MLYVRGILMETLHSSIHLIYWRLSKLCWILESLVCSWLRCLAHYEFFKSDACKTNTFLSLVWTLLICMNVCVDTSYFPFLFYSLHVYPRWYFPNYQTLVLVTTVSLQVLYYRQNAPTLWPLSLWPTILYLLLSKLPKIMLKFVCSTKLVGKVVGKVL